MQNYAVHYSPNTTASNHGICQSGVNTTPVVTTVKHKVTCKKCLRKMGK